MSKIVQIAILDFNVNEALKKGLDIKDEQIMSSMPKFYNFTIQTNDECFYVAELKIHYILKECQKNFFMKLKKISKKKKKILLVWNLSTMIIINV